MPPRASRWIRPGNLLVADLGSHHIRRVGTAGVISTVAGDRVGQFNGDLGDATGASLNYPAGRSLDPGGDIFIVDHGKCRLRRVAAGAGVIATVAGNGACGFSGDGEAATSASLNHPTAIAFDHAGMVLSDSIDHRLRRVSALTQPSSTPSATPSPTPYCAPSQFRPLPRTDLVGTLVGTALTPGAATLVASEAACRQACCDAPACDGFSLEATVALYQPAAPCHLCVNVMQLIPISGYASGVLESVL